jgi:hypothetical protein
VELARAYATYANQRLLSNDYQAAADLAGRAQQLAAQLGVMDIYSDALNTQAVCLRVGGRPWSGQLRRALDIALSSGHHAEAARAYHNLIDGHLQRFEFAAAEEYLTDGIAFCDEHDITAIARCLRVERACVLELTGRWDQAVELSAELLPDTVRSPRNRVLALTQLGLIRARRSEPGAWGYLDEASALAADSAEPRFKVITRLARAEAHWLDGTTGDARREAELAYAASQDGDTADRGRAATWLLRTGSVPQASGEVAEPYRLLLDGDAKAAAAAWARLGNPYDTALAGYDAADRVSLRETLQIAARLGAQPLARLARQRLRWVESGSAPTGPHPGLTAGRS